MDDELIDTDRLTIDRRSRVPGAGFFYPDSFDEEREEADAKATIEGADAIVVTDSDADGLGCVALIREAYDASLDPEPFLEAIDDRLDGDADDQIDDRLDGDADAQTDAADTADASANRGDSAAEAGGEPIGSRSSVALVASGPHSLATSLERVAEYAADGVDLFVCDLCPDEYGTIADPIEALSDRCDRLAWYDHHQWTDDAATAVREAGVDLVVGDSDTECSTDVALRSMPYEFDDRFVELAAVTRDHDLWVNDDPRSQDLADYAFWTGAEEYVAIVGAYGVELPDPVVEYIEHRRVEKTNLIQKAVDRAEYKRVGPWTVGVTYGRCSQNEVADALRAAGADAAVIVKPAGSASIRGSDDFEKAHLVARQVNGGGHPKASGCKPDIYDDMLDYAYHWTTNGESAKRVILAAFERVADGSVSES
ncbi:MAG: DHH family phosphoesterase [Halobacteriota archaeon]